jgi:cytidylate kinase
MNHLKLIHEYLKEKGAFESIPPSRFPFVTISREAGAGGHLLSYVLTTDFLQQEDRDLFGGWHVFDRQLCEIVAEDPELRTSVDDLLAERYESSVHEFLEGVFTGRSRCYMECKRTFRVVRILAMLGKVILVGRVGASVTRDLPMGVHIRLVAPEASRVRWMMKKLHLSKAGAEDAVRRQDQDRHRMAKSFFSVDISDPLLYDTVWNSEKADPHVISHSIIEMVKLRVAQQGKGG